VERANETRGVLSTARVTRGRHRQRQRTKFSIGGQKRAFDIVRRIGFDPRRYSADSACSLARGVRTVSTDERRHADPVRLPRTDSNLVMSILHVAARLTRDTLHTLYSAYTALTCVYEYISCHCGTTVAHSTGAPLARPSPAASYPLGESQCATYSVAAGAAADG